MARRRNRAGLRGDGPGENWNAVVQDSDRPGTAFRHDNRPPGGQLSTWTRLQAGWSTEMLLWILDGFALQRCSGMIIRILTILVLLGKNNLMMHGNINHDPFSP